MNVLSIRYLVVTKAYELEIDDWIVTMSPNKLFVFVYHNIQGDTHGSSVTDNVINI